MEDKSKYLQDIQDIRAIMERSTKFISLSGLSGVIAGVIAMCGAGLAKYMIHKDISNRGPIETSDSILNYGIMDIGLNTVYYLIALGIVIFLFALLGAYYFTQRRAHAMNEKIWNVASKKMAFQLSVPLITGGIFSLILIGNGFYGLVAPVTLIFYGLACVSASIYAPSDILSLGIVMILLGIVSTQFIGYGLLFWAIGFGVCHIVYGYLMYIKYERK